MKKRPPDVSAWQWHALQEPPEKGERIKRNKYGVRVYSLNVKKVAKKSRYSPYYLDVAVNNSEDGTATSVRLNAGGKQLRYTFDLRAMLALREEFARGQQIRRFPRKKAKKGRT